MFEGILIGLALGGVAGLAFGLYEARNIAFKQDRIRLEHIKALEKYAPVMEVHELRRKYE